MPVVEGGVDRADAAAPRVHGARRRQGPRAASSTRIARPSACGATSTTSSKAPRSARTSRTTRSTSTCSRGIRSTGGCRVRSASRSATATSRPIGEEALSPPVNQKNLAGVLLRRADLAARHVPVRRPRGQRALSGRKAGLPGSRASRTSRGRSASCSAPRPPTTPSPSLAAWPGPRATPRSRSSTSSACTPATSRSRSATRRSSPKSASAWTCRCGGRPAACRASSRGSATRSTASSSATR